MSKQCLNKTDFDKSIKFVQAAMTAVENCNEAEFVCPMCGGTATAVKAASNGHVHAYCEQCDCDIMM